MGFFVVFFIFLFFPRSAQVLAGTIKGIKGLPTTLPNNVFFGESGLGSGAPPPGKPGGVSSPPVSSTETLEYVAVISLSPKGVPGSSIHSPIQRNT